VLTRWQSLRRTAPGRPIGEQTIFTLCVAAAGTLSLALESFRLANSGVTFDEAATIAYAKLDFHGLYAAMQSSDAFFAAYYGWMHVWMRLGESEAAIRSFSVLCGAGAVIAVSLLARRLCDMKAGIVAGMLAAVSPLLFDVARQARPYALLVLLAAMSSLMFLFAAERPTLRRWSSYVFISAVGCYIHLFLFCLVAAHALWALVSRRNLYRCGLPWAVLGIALSTTPLLNVLHHYSGINGYIQRPTLRALIDTWEWFAGSRELAALAALLLVAVIAPRLRPRGGIAVTPVAMFLILTTVVPPLLIFAESSIAKPMYLQRYLVEAWPSYIVVIAIVLTRLRPTSFAPICALVVALQVYAVLSVHMQIAQNWRAASDVILERALPGDQLVVYPAIGTIPYEYYREQLHVQRAPMLRFPRWSPFPLTMTSTGNSKFSVGAGGLSGASRPRRIWFLIGWTDDPRTRPGLRTLTHTLPPPYRLAFDRRLIHESVLRFDRLPARSNRAK
jgi:mannosyltransferase